MNFNTRNIILLTFFILFEAAGYACEIKLEVSEKYTKETYRPGDVLVIKVNVLFDHRDCNVDIADTKFTANGCEIIGATKWTQLNSNAYSRKLQVKIVSEAENAVIVCKRTCEKEGGSGKITLKKG